MIDTTMLNAMFATPAGCEIGYATDCDGTATHYDAHPAGQAQGEDTRHGWPMIWYCLNCAHQLARDL